MQYRECVLGKAVALALRPCWLQSLRAVTGVLALYSACLHDGVSRAQCAKGVACLLRVDRMVSQINNGDIISIELFQHLMHTHAGLQMG